MTHLADRTAAELLAGYAAGEFTPVDAAEASLDRIEERDGELNAFVLVDREAALDSARDSARRWESGETLGPGDGVPTSIKDIFATKDWPTLRGSNLIESPGTWTFDAPCVARLRETGAVLLGKVTTPEFAWKGTTDSLRHGITGNPWNPAMTAGGSSGGSSAAVGAGMGAWSVGTDAGGSVRIPASFTGTVALKPTFGLVPMFPASPFGTLAHAGPMTRTVTDAALLMDVISGFDARDWAALPTVRGSFLDGLQDGVDGLRIAFSPTLGYVENDAEVERLVREAVGTLESLGAVVEEVDPGFDDPLEPFHVLWFSGAAKVVEAFGPEALEHIDPGLRAGIEEYADATALDFLDATAVRMELGTRMGMFHEKYDLLVTPTMPITAFDGSRQAPEGWSSDLWTSWTPYTYPFNMTQQPAASVPCGVAAEGPGAGLPVGLQFVAARTQDQLVLRAARAYEKAAGEQFSRPVDVPAVATATGHSGAFGDASEQVPAG